MLTANCVVRPVERVNNHAMGLAKPVQRKALGGGADAVRPEDSAASFSSGAGGGRYVDAPLEPSGSTTWCVLRRVRRSLCPRRCLSWPRRCRCLACSAAFRSFVFLRRTLRFRDADRWLSPRFCDAPPFIIFRRLSSSFAAFHRGAAAVTAGGSTTGWGSSASTRPESRSALRRAG